MSVEEHPLIRLFSSVRFPAVKVTGRNIIDAIKASPVHENSSFHQEDLFQHLLMTANACQQYAEERGWCGNTDCGLDSKWVFLLCGFLHDIGKPGAYRPMYNDKRWAAKGHGLIGAAMLDSFILHSEEMKRVFELSERDAAALALATNYHMCRCPAPDTVKKFDSDRVKLLANGLSKGAAYLLVALRYGDFHGKKPLLEFDHDVQQKYEDELLQMTNSPPDVLSDENRSKGVLITVTGRSGAGKTTRAKQLVKWLKEKYDMQQGKDIVYINRDDTIKRLVGSHERYVSDKNTYAPIVNREIQSLVTSALAGHRLCILDTMLMMDPRARKDVLADIHPSTMRIDLWVTRFPDTISEEETTAGMGVAAEQQRAINCGNEISMIDPVGSNIHWVELESLMDSTQIKFLEETSNKTRAHYTVPVGHDRTLMMDGGVKPLLENLLKNRRAMKTPPLLHESADMSLQCLVNHLVNSVGLIHTKRFFVSHAFCYNCQEVSPGGNAYTICVKYIDQKNKLWRLRWAREARGAAFLVQARKDGFETHIFKMTIPRCVEVFTKFHSERGLKESQDMGDDFDCTFLDNSQRDVVTKFITKPEERFETDGEEWHISEKIDGCLFVVTVLSPDAALYNFLIDVLNDQSSNLSKIWHVITSEGYIVIPATSGSIQVGDKMKSTLITAFSDVIPETVTLTSEMEADSIWHENLKERFGEIFVQLSKSFSKGKIDHYTAILEAVCKGRKCYDDYTHHELAVSYNFSRVFLLGLFLGQDYHPTHKMSMTQTVPFLHFPRSWKILSPRDALDKLAHLDEKVLNMETDFSTHPEGFVVTRWSTRDEKIVASCKLKSPIYYKAHNVSSRYNSMFSKKKNRPLIPEKNMSCELSKLSSVFPEEERMFFIQRVLPSEMPGFIKDCYERVMDKRECLDNLPFSPEKRKRDPQCVVRFILANNYTSGLGLAWFEMFVNHFSVMWNDICMNKDTVISAIHTLLTINASHIKTFDIKINKDFCDLFE